MIDRRLKTLYVGNHLPTLKFLTADERIDLQGVLVETRRLTAEIITYCHVARINLVCIPTKTHLQAGLANFDSIDLLAICSFGWILEESHINFPRLGTVNIHYSYLPYFRGRHPVSRAIQQGAAWTGITLHYVDTGIDTGPILSQRKIYLDPLSNDRDVYNQLTALLPGLINEAISKLLIAPDAVFKPKQSGSYYPPIDYNTECHINWKHSVRDIYNLIRSQTRFKGAFSFVRGERINFKGAKILNTKEYLNKDKTPIKPGTIINRQSSNVLIAYANADHSILLKCTRRVPDMPLKGEVLE